MWRVGHREGSDTVTEAAMATSDKLETPEDAMRISARLTIAAATGELAAPQVNAALSAVKEWRKAYEADVLDKRLDELERRGAR